ncbi:7-cyano-7-deazaguanine synthase QueC [Fibrobacter sp. UWB11]|uniref:7-cyano-7-deazaguanine synthase QueC n=1 Tax=Fibrobacter sp. UWB11 TaxID=1896202 RepID=UPI0009280B26|nr:7-cyano-7-deazaguanine synthase QueC [Fibrobacter sp. UWB11]SIO03145.1 7-cyano-7-deazaguanine synthase [Fibrobacter sp. UWB11]
MKDALLVLSGGMDSVTLLYDRAADIALAVSFDYGSNHNDKEIPFARMHCEKLGIPHITIPLKFMHDYFTSSLLSGAEAIPEGTYADENMKSTVVPFRNGIMLSVAAGLAESRDLKRVMMANHFGDHAIYPDCREEFVKNMSAAISAGTYANITIDAPYTNISKADIARKGKALGLDYSETWSCYKGGRVHCDKCATCLERKAALAEAGINDTTEYEA